MGSPISRPLSSTKNLPCAKKMKFFRVINFDDNRDFKLRVFITDVDVHAFRVASPSFTHPLVNKSDKLNLLYIKSVLSITIQSFQNFNTLSTPLFSVFLATDYFSALVLIQEWFYN